MRASVITLAAIPAVPIRTLSAAHVRASLITLAAIPAVPIRTPFGLLMCGHPPYTGKYFAVFLQASLRTRQVFAGARQI